MPLPTYKVRLTANDAVTPTVRRLEFAFEGDKPFSYTPGQFVSFLLPGEEKPLKRSYSIGSLAESTRDVPGFEIVVAYVDGGRATEFFFAAEPGLVTEIQGPFGLLVMPENLPRRFFLIGTGTGIAPYRTMLPQIEKRLREENCEIHVLFGIRSPEELFYGEDFLRYARDNEHFHAHFCYSRRLPDEPGPHDSLGYVQERLGSLDPDPETDLVYLCGNPKMVDDVFSLLQEKEFPTRQVKREKYVFSKF